MFAPFHHGRAKRLIDGPAMQLHALVDDAVRQSDGPGTLTQAAFDLRPWPAIARLFGPCCPAAVAGFVALGVVDAIEREPFGRFTQVGDEVGVAVATAPAQAHVNATTAVIRIRWMPRIEASAHHRGPFAVGACLFSVLSGGDSIHG